MPPFNPPSTLTPLLNHLLPPTPTIALQPRQVTVTVIPNADNDNDPDDASTLSGGAIAGIVIGSIAGFLLLVWIIRSCTNLGAPPGEAVPGRPWYGGVKDEYPPKHRKMHRHSSRHASRGRRRSRSRSVAVYEEDRYVGRSRSRRGSVPVTEVPPVVVREDRGYYGYGGEPVRVSRSRSRGRYD